MSAVHIDQVRDRLEQRGTVCQMEEVMELCPGLTWNQVFLAIDHLSRTGQVRMARTADKTYTVQAYRPAVRSIPIAA